MSGRTQRSPGTTPAVGERSPAIDDEAWKAISLTAKFLFLDGASSSGKSSMKNALLQDQAFKFSYARRYTTRQVRPDDAQSDDYIFISRDRFLALETAGDFIESRHFLFGMSYGISKSVLAAAAKECPQVLSLMNLGHVKAIKTALPQAICVLLDAPLEVIERRIRERGFNTDEQIAERLQNAKSVRQIRHEYDFVLENRDGEFDLTYARLREYLREKGLRR